MRAHRDALRTRADGDGVENGAESCAKWVDIDGRNIVAAAVADHGDGRERAIFELVGNGYGAGYGRGASYRHVNRLNDKEIGRVGLNATAHDLQSELVRDGQELMRNGCDDLPIADDLNASRWNRDGRVVKKYLRAAGKAGAKNLHTRQIGCGSKRCLRNRSAGNSADDARTGIGTWDNDFRDFGGLESAEIDDFDLAVTRAAGRGTAGFDDESLIRCRVDSGCRPRDGETRWCRSGQAARRCWARSRERWRISFA